MLTAVLCSLLSIASPQDIVVVCPENYSEGLQTWSDHRTSQGYRVHQVNSASDPVVVRQSILKKLEQCRPGQKYVLIAGDAPSNPAHCNPEKEVPTFYLRSEVVHKFGSEKTIASDLPYSDIDEDSIPDVALGRISAKSKDQLQGYLDRVVAYEKSEDFGEWRHKVDVVAGVGGFGPIADGAIELVTRRFLTDGIPDEYSLNMTYASPTSIYCPNPYDFHSSLVQRLNAGSLFWIYIGHGHVLTLDQFHVENQSIEILNTGLLKEIRIPKGPPIAVFLACYTGAFDANQNCLAESMIMLPEGPIAAIAGTRMTMPYGMSSLAAEMLEVCFQEKVSTLGELVLLAKQRSVAMEGPSSPRRKMLNTLAAALSPEGHDLMEERKEHLRLIHILGDPSMRLWHPLPMEIRAPKTSKPGETLEVTGAGPREGTKVTLELTYRRDQVPQGVEPRRELRSGPDDLKKMDETHRAANDLVLVRKELDCVDGKFYCKLGLPPNVQGRLVARAYMVCDQGMASCSQQILVRE